MAESSSWLVPLLAAGGGGTAGSMTAALLTGRARRLWRARKRLRELRQRLGLLEAAQAQADAHVAALAAAYRTLRREIGDIETDLGSDTQQEDPIP